MKLLTAAVTVSALLQASMGQFDTTDAMDWNTSWSWNVTYNMTNGSISSVSCGDEVSGSTYGFMTIVNFTNDAAQDVLITTCGSTLENSEIYVGTNASLTSPAFIANATEMTDDYCEDEAYELLIEDLAAGTYLIWVADQNMTFSMGFNPDTTTADPSTNAFVLYAVCGEDDIGDFYDADSAVRVSMAMAMALVSVVMAMFE